MLKRHNAFYTGAVDLTVFCLSGLDHVLAIILTRKNLRCRRERPRDASFHWIFCRVTQGHSNIRNDTLKQGIYKSLLVSHCNCVSISYRLWDIQCQMMTSPWNLGYFLGVIQGHSLEMTSFDRSHMSSDWRSKGMAMALSRIISEVKRDIGRKIRNFLYPTYIWCPRQWEQCHNV